MATKKKTTAKQARKPEISPKLIETICGQLARNARVRRTLPERGRVHIDRQLPFLCVYRQPVDREDVLTRALVRGEASHLIAPSGRKYNKSVADLVHGIARSMAEEFGAFLIIEIWAGTDGSQASNAAVPTVLPVFQIHAPKTATPHTVSTLASHLKRIKVLKQGVEVKTVLDGKVTPPGMTPLLRSGLARPLNCYVIGVVVPPVYREGDNEFPMVLRSLRQRFGRALRQTTFDFASASTTHQPAHFHTMGRHAVVKAVWDIDRRLAAVSNLFDYLMDVTPINTTAAWNQFKRNHFEKAPQFHYRPQPIDPALLKRRLFLIPIENVEDPTLQHLFQEKRDELELQLTMMDDRETPRFMYESLQNFGGVSESLRQDAMALLAKLPPRAVKTKADSKSMIDAATFEERANAEFAWYRQQWPEFAATTRVTSDVSSLIVSQGKLMISPKLNFPETRVEALLAHEVGTHLLTYYNGKAQPFRQLYAGLAGYEELQEGLAVLSEHLVGGLSAARMRLLAGRVMAVHAMVEGASFVETYRVLNHDFGFNQYTAYGITMRVHRGGGLTKDAIYLRGLQTILQYVQGGGELSPLMVGKMSAKHIPIVQELQHRKVLEPIPFLPRYLSNPAALERLKALREGSATVAELVNGK